MKEQNIQSLIMVELSKYGIPIRINSGIAWGGRLVNGIIEHPRAIKLAPEGFPDILFIGENGKVLFIECKTLKGKQRESQKKFQKLLEQYGHTYLIARSPEDIKKFMEDINE